MKETMSSQPSDGDGRQSQILFFCSWVRWRARERRWRSSIEGKQHLRSFPHLRLTRGSQGGVIIQWHAERWRLHRVHARRKRASYCCRSTDGPREEDGPTLLLLPRWAKGDGSGPGLEAMVGSSCCDPLEVAGWANCCAHWAKGGGEARREMGAWPDWEEVKVPHLLLWLKGLNGRRG
jgi:hypothetical protein